MSTNHSDFWSEAAGICTIVGLIIGTCLSALTLYFTWRQHKQSESRNAADNKRPDEDAQLKPKPKRKPFCSRYAIYALIVAALISFAGTVGLAASIPRIQALHSSKPQSTAFPTNISTSDSPTSTVSIPSSASPTPAPTTSYLDLGCYRDSHEVRILNATGTYTDSVTVAGCAEFCAKYAYFGTEDGMQCFCGDGIAHSFHAEDRFCNSTCAGNATEFCGVSLGKVGT